jgi:glyoxylase-like metal-dependent hydrolase (beta-lactamase superfamily II)
MEETMTLDRRTLFVRTAVAGAFVASAPAILRGIAPPAEAKVPLAGAQGASFFRMKIGEMEVTALHEGVAARPLDAGFVRNAKLEDVQAVLAENMLATNQITISFTTLVVNTGSKIVLIDTGFADNGGATNGRTANQLRAAGIDPAQVDTVLISHFHGDHLQGARMKDGKLTYPNAEIMVSEPEWNFWMDDARAAAAPEAMRGAFAGVHRVLKPNANDVKRFRWGQEVVTGITALDASGHTPGHTAFAISSGGKTLLYVADLTNNPLLFARNPEWRVVFDMDADKAVETRKRFLDMAMADKSQVSFYHANFPATGFIGKEGAGYRLIPAAWSTAL